MIRVLRIVFVVLALVGSAEAEEGEQLPHLVVVIAESEYETKTTLPEFAKKELAGRFRISVIEGGEGGCKFPGLKEALADADVLLVSVRRRAMPDAEMEALKAYVAAGKPLLGIRTASHAFWPRQGKAPEGHSIWETWDGEVFGGNYTGHHGNKMKTFATVSADHAVTRNLAKHEVATGGSLYKVLPLAEGATVLMRGRADGISEVQPVAWTFERKDGGKSFYTSLGHVEDFKTETFRGLLRNALDWAVGREIVNLRSTESALAAFRVAPDLAMDLVLAEPLISQPLHLSFDERGRMWVVEYRQYPDPAGLKEMSRDKVWRVDYDKKPPPPPHAADSPFRGKDRISIHEDEDGDGVFEKHSVFVDGLNMATSVAHGGGGVWVTNPPYLLFYPDEDGDDVPDGPPVVHLDGFGLEDTHSIANSLTVGPDGWLYGAQGSTVSAAIVRPGVDEDPVQSMGQHIWRYHPERQVYEIFAEGGGNAFGVDFDSKGRVFSGHNGGDTRGFHYVQGGYFRKNFGKHGALTNPYAFGYFKQMKNAKVARFTHQFVVYENDALPEAYRGKIWALDVLHNKIVCAELIPDGSTFRTEDVSTPVSSEDPWFRPVHITEGPKGDLYVADWYDSQVNHYRNHEGQIDHAMGRVYRIRAAEVQEREGRGASELEEFLRRYREEALDEEGYVAGMKSGDSAVRRWAVRLAGDDGRVNGEIWKVMREMVELERDGEVRSQLAATARRIRAELGLELAEGLAGYDADRNDPHIPLMIWWAIEEQCEGHPDWVLRMFEKKRFWEGRIVREVLVERVMKRFALAGSREDLERCARLLELAPDEESRAVLMAGFEEAFKGREMVGFPPVLLEELGKAEGVVGRLVRIRQGDVGEVGRALADIEKEPAKHLRLVTVLGEVHAPSCVPVLLQLISKEESDEVLVAAIGALQNYPDMEIAEGMLESYRRCSPAVRDALRNALASRLVWSRELVAAVGEEKIEAKEFSLPLVQKLKAHGDEELDAAVAKLSGEGGKRAGSVQAEIGRIKGIVAAGRGVAKPGEKIFAQRCAGCHLMYGKGGRIGPDLTSYQRDDLDDLLLAVVDPGAEIREGFENVIVTTKDGAVHSGFLLEQGEKTLMLRDLAGQVVTVPVAEVAKQVTLPTSLMPAGLLEGVGDQELRDLVAYLRTTTPPY